MDRGELSSEARKLKNICQSVTKVDLLWVEVVQSFVYGVFALVAVWPVDVMAYACAVPVPEDGVDIAETEGVSGACTDPDDGVVAVVVEAEDVPEGSEVCRKGGAVNPPET